MQGQYIFGDLRDGDKLYNFDADTVAQGTLSRLSRVYLKYNGTTYNEVGDFTGSGVGSRNADIRFGYDEDNELYIMSKYNGRIYKVVGATKVEVYGSLANISTRGEVGVGNDVLIGGFVIQGDEDLTVLIQGVGEELVSADSSLAGSVLTDVSITLYDNMGNEISSNDDWTSEDAVLKQQVMADTGSFELARRSKSSSLLETLSPGVYTVILSGVGDAEGVALIEVYEVPSE